MSPPKPPLHAADLDALTCSSAIGYHRRDREAGLQLFRDTFHDPAGVELCTDCAEAILDGALASRNGLSPLKLIAAHMKPIPYPCSRPVFAPASATPR